MADRFTFFVSGSEYAQSSEVVDNVTGERRILDCYSDRLSEMYGAETVLKLLGVAYDIVVMPHEDANHDDGDCFCGHECGVD